MVPPVWVFWSPWFGNTISPSGTTYFVDLVSTLPIMSVSIDVPRVEALKRKLFERDTNYSIGRFDERNLFLLTSPLY